MTWQKYRIVVTLERHNGIEDSIISDVGMNEDIQYALGAWPTRKNPAFREVKVTSSKYKGDCKHG